MRTVRAFILSLLASTGLTSCVSGDGAADSHVIGFYNVENLFDTLDDPGKDDEDFLPDGQYAWDDRKYGVKLGNIAHVIAEMAKENGQFHSVLGLAEVENDNVLNDLIAHEELAEAGYKYVHYESPDERGIDVALLYRPSQFKLLESKAISFESKTRDILMVRGELAGEMFAFFVAHLPSRRGDGSEDARCRGARKIHKSAMALEKKYPGIKIVVMGDMNDNPEDRSMAECLRGREKVSEVGAGDFFSPFLSMHREGFGSEEYRGEWNIFDIIMVNRALVSEDGDGLKIFKTDADHYGSIFDKEFLVQQKGRYKGTPYRTFSGDRFIKGYSDHYPTYIKLSR